MTYDDTAKFGLQGVCLGCSCKFRITAKSGKGMYCSQRCAAVHIGKRTMGINRRVIPKTTSLNLICHACGKQFSRWRATVEQSQQKGCRRVFCSIKCAAKYAPQSGAITKHGSGWFKSRKMYSRAASRWVEIDGRRFFARSSWEANYAHYLEYQRISGLISDWFHEPFTFWFPVRRGVVSYLPDFKVVNLDGTCEWHEVKGWMDSRSKTKLKRMSKYYPNEKVIVVGATWFSSANRNLAYIVPGWVKGR